MAKTRKKPKKGTPKKALAGSEPCTLILPARTVTVTTPMGPMQIGLPEEQFTLPECCCGSCCEACDALETGKWGILWRDASGEWQCLPGPVGDKRLGGDANGPYWANP